MVGVVAKFWTAEQKNVRLGGVRPNLDKVKNLTIIMFLIRLLYQPSSWKLPQECQVNANCFH